MQFHYELLPFLLASPIEPRSFEYHVFPYLEKLVKFLQHCLLSSSDILVESRTDSASSPIQYRRVLIWRACVSLSNPDAVWNCSYRFFHRDHSSGLRKLKGLIGFEPSRHRCHHVRFNIIYIGTKTAYSIEQNNRIYTNQSFYK